MAKMCVVHPKEAAVAECFQCHKALCKSCILVAPHGSFCGSECSVVFREMKQRAQAEGRKKMGSGTKVALFFVILLGAFVGIHLAVKYAKVDSLKSLDLIGSLMSSASEPQTPPQKPENGK